MPYRDVENKKAHQREDYRLHPEKYKTYKQGDGAKQAARLRSAKRYRESKEAGLCGVCGIAPALPDRVLCDHCATLQRERHRRDPSKGAKSKRLLYYRRVATGLCTRCGDKAAVGFLNCQGCRAYGRAHKRRIVR